MGRVFRIKRRLPDGSIWTSKRFYIEWTDGTGKQRQKAAATKKSDAQQLLREAEAKATREKLGLEIPTKPKQDLALDDLKAEFLSDCELRLRPKTVEGYKENLNSMLGRWLPDIRLVSQLTPARIRQYQKDSAKKVSPRTVNARLRVLQVMLNWGVREELLSVNSIQACRMLPDRTPNKARSLDSKQVSKLLKASGPTLAPIWELFLATGLRRKELVCLTWADVNFRKGVIEVTGDVAKNHQARQIPLTKRARQILRAWNNTDQDPTSPVLQDIEGSKNIYWALGKHFARCCKQAGIQASLHDLRHTFATDLATKGCPPNVCQALMGHSTAAFTQEVYARARQQDIKKGIRVLDSEN